MENIEHIKFEDAPETWSDRCSGDGYKRIINENVESVLDSVLEFLGYDNVNIEEKYDDED